jgi:hypothetical protein
VSSDDIITIRPENVVMLPSISEQAPPENLYNLLCNPAELLDLLEFHAGNVNAFLSHLSKNANERQKMFYKVLETLEKSPEFHRKWKKAIVRSQKVRIQMLQCSALTNLERYDPFIYPSDPDKPPVIKQTNDLANAKLLLGSVFEKEMLQTKAGFKGVGGGGPIDTAGEDTPEEEEALAEAESED